MCLPSAITAERLPIRTYTVADGLAHNTINRIVPDPRGFLWFCTVEGLSLFDGYRFTNYDTGDGLPHHHVSDLLRTPDGEYWIATYGGLVHFKPGGGRSNAGPMFRVLTPPSTAKRAPALTVLTQTRDGVIWAGSLDGLLRLQHRNARDELVAVEWPSSDDRPTGIEALLEDRQGILWIGADNGLFRRAPDGRVTRYTKRDGLPDDSINDLLEDQGGRLWVATRFAGFFPLAIDPIDDRPIVRQVYGRSKGFIDWVFDLYEASNGHFFVATNHGLLEFPSTDSVAFERGQLYTTHNGLVYHEVANVAEDRDGNVWIGSVNGAMKMARGGFRTFDKADGVYLVNSLFTSAAGEIYAYGYVADPMAARAQHATPTEVDTYAPRIGRFDGQRFTWLLPALPGTIPSWSPRPFILQARTGEWWIGTTHGLAMFPRLRTFADLARSRPEAVYTAQHGLATDVVYSTYEDGRGDIWISTIAGPKAVNGLARWDRSTRNVRNLAHTPGLPSLGDHLVTAFHEDRLGQMWVGFSPGGVARYSSGCFEVFTEMDGLAGGAVNELFADAAGRLWVATSRGGISRLDAPAAARPTFVTYSTAQGLSSNRVMTVTEDGDGRIYVGTGRGLDQITPESGRIRHFTTADGVAPGDSVAALRDASGTIWFSTRQGLARFLPKPEPKSQAPAVWITGLRLGGQQWTVSPLGEAVVDLPDLETGHNQLQVDFVGLSFAPGEVLRYQYRLEGSGADWSAPADQRTVHLAGLASGTYTFSVRAIDANHVTSPEPALVRFTVLPPVWQRGWFLALGTAALTLLLYGWHRHKIVRLLELERVRTRIASDLHDDIGAALSRIAVLSEAAGQEAGESNTPVKSRLSVIANASREVLDAMSDIVWAVNPQRDQVRDLAHRMRRFASDMFSARQIAFSFRAPTGEQRLTVGADVRRHVFLVFKEAITNVLRHADCTCADLELRVRGRQLTLTIADNGHGFDPASIGDGNGLSSMRLRARMMGGDLHIDSKNGSGTVVRLTVPRRAKIDERQRRLFPSA